MNDSLILQKNDRFFLMVNYPDRYHIITVNDDLDEDKEQKLLSKICSDAEIDEMGLCRQTVRKNDLKSVKIHGKTAGSALVLNSGKGNLKYVLSDDYTDKDIAAFFNGIKRTASAKKIKSQGDDWREKLQTKSMLKIMSPVGTALNAAGWVSFILTFFFGKYNEVFSIVTLAVMAIVAAVYLIYPQYFSVMGKKEYERAGYTAKVKHIEVALILPGAAIALRCIRDFDFLSWGKLIMIAVAAGAVFSVIMFVRSREVRENLSVLAGVAIISSAVFIGILGEVNHLTDFDAAPPTEWTVKDTDKTHGSRHTSYYCTVRSPSSKELVLSVSGTEYAELEPEEKVLVYVGKGGLGIDYAYFVGEAD